MDERFHNTEDWDGLEYEGLSKKFQAFLLRAATCRPIFASPLSTQSSQHTQSSHKSQSQSSTTSTQGNGSFRRQVILLEDLPNILHPPTQAAFHAALEAFVSFSESTVAPLVLIISDAGLRGEDAEADTSRWRSRAKEAMDVRNVLPPSLLNSPYVTQIRYAL